MYGEQRRPLIFGIDFDDTITKDKELFKEMILLFKKYGCEMYIVTARDIDSGWCEELTTFHKETGIDVIFTGTTAKEDIIDIDIWIDDFPIAITNDFKEAYWTPGKTSVNYVKTLDK